MKPHRCLALAGFINALFLCTAAMAEVPTYRLTLAEAMDMAQAYSPRLSSLRAFQNAGEARLQMAKAGYMPSLDVTAGYARYSNVPEFVLALPGAPPRTIFPNIPDNYRARLAVTIPLYTGGRTAASIRAATDNLTAAGDDIGTGTADIALETSSAYWDLVTARERERVFAEALKAYESHLTDAGNREKFGMAARNEVLAVQVERDRAELARIQATNQVDVSSANMVRLLGVAPGSIIEPAELLEPLSLPNLAIEALVSEALAKRPERAALQARIGAAESSVRVEQSSRFPQINAVAGYDYANPNQRILPPTDAWKGSWGVSFNLALNLFDGGRISGAVAQAQAQREAARRQLQELDDQIRMQVTSRVLDLRTASAALRVSNRNLQAAKENQKVTGDRYREGVSPSSDLLDAEAALLHAGLDLTETLARERFAWASLQRAVGR